jgi:N-acetylglucosamine kinase-like BadF-type ATPase
MKLFLGVDGGQSSTVALIADEAGRILGWGRGGPCNHVATTEARAKFALAMQESLGAACLEAGLDASSVSFEAACLGFSGGSADKEAYSREVIRSRSFGITTDAEIALAGATGGAAGIIVIAGTGSIAFGKNAQDRMARAGGWGYIFGDEGGAFDISRQALRAALAMEEGWGPATTLKEVLLDRTGAMSANTLMHDWYNRFDRMEIARLAPVVDAAATAGDVMATEILERCGQQLAALVTHVHRVCFQPDAMPTVSYVGGVFQSALLTRALKQAVQSELNCPVSTPLYPPAGGAVLMALGQAGIQVRLSGMPAAIKS